MSLSSATHPQQEFLSVFIREIREIRDSEGASESRMTRMTQSNADKIPASTPIETDELVLSNTPSVRGLLRVSPRHLRHLRFRTDFQNRG